MHYIQINKHNTRVMSSFTEQIYSALTNLVPFWSANAVNLFGLGNEYTAALNIILTQSMKLFFAHINDTVCMAMIVVVAGLFGLKHLGLDFRLDSFLAEKNIVVLNGMENVKENKLFYSNKINLINQYLIQERKLRNVCYHNDITVSINNIKQYKIYKNIYLDIKRGNNAGTDGLSAVTYRLWSYKDNIEDFLSYLQTTYKVITRSEITLIGNEIGNKLEYPTPINAINYYLSEWYQFPKLKCMLSIQMTQEPLDHNTHPNRQPVNKEGKEQSNTEMTKLTKPKELPNYSFTIDNVSNFLLDKDQILLTIYRENNLVYYNIKPENVDINCKNWVNHIVDIYNQNKQKELKNKLVLTGQETLWYQDNAYKKYYYSKPMWAINWYVIDQLKYQHYECVNGDEKTSVYGYVLDALEFFKIQDDLYLTIKKQKQYASYDKTVNNRTDVEYVLYSNSHDIKSLLDGYMEQFKAFSKDKCPNTRLYHFTYSGMKDNALIFTTQILSEENTDEELFETFDKLHNENVDIIKADMDQLKDLEYYKKHGLKRKKGYLFHGIPGCGKTSTVVSMALYDKRHILEIPFSLLTKHEEFHKIMNLTAINNIDINRNNIIMLFDEIDIGMETIQNRTKEEVGLSQLNASIQNDLEEIKSCFVDKKKDVSDHKISLGSLLSRLDGIGNYNGLIIVATTNYIEKLDPALYRELRLTPIKFQKLRKIDCIRIIRSYFGDAYDEAWHDVLHERVFTPTKLISLCQQQEGTDVAQFFAVLQDIQKCLN